MKNIQLKIWPELIGYLPALTLLKRGGFEKEHDFTIDFSNVEKVSSTGLNFILLNIIKIAKEFPHKKWSLIEPKNRSVHRCIQNLGGYDILLNHLDLNNLFEDNARFLKPEKAENTNANQHQAIYTIRFTDFTNRRMALESFKDYLFENFRKHDNIYKIPKNILVTILNEIAKNSSDHTIDNAYIGIDFFEENDGSLKFNFSLGDFGVGICQSIKDFFVQDNDNKRRRIDHMSLYEAYYHALQNGFTTKTFSKSNKGLGMSMIYNSSKEINLNLSIFDAESMGKLNLIENQNTHAQLRKIFFDIGHKVGFYYYGEMQFKKNRNNERN